MSAIRRLQDEVARALRAAGLRPGDGLAVACSHGPDSLALADAVLALRRRLRPGAVTLIYVDHGLRPEAAAREGEAVLAFAAARDAAARVLGVTVGRARGRGLEDAARAARYAALDDAATAAGARFVLLGHTASDQAETFLLRLLRGAGAHGLAGIPAARGRYLRPLLALDRAAVLAYVAARGLSPSHDASNDDLALARNRVRHGLLPALRAENPAADAALARAADALREVADALDWAAAAAEPGLGLVRGRGTVRLSAAAFAALPAAVQPRLLARLGATGLEARHLTALRALAARPPAGSRRLDLPGLVARREYEQLVLLLAPTATPAIRADVRVEGDEGPYDVRSWRPGDRMRPARLAGRSRKLQDLFVDRKVPRALRSSAVVVVRRSDGTIVWAQHVGPASGVNVRVALTNVDPEAINEGASAP